MDPINVALCIDESHALPACAVLLSLFAHDPERRIQPYLVIDGSSPARRLIGEVCGRFDRTPVIATAIDAEAAHGRLHLADRFPRLDRVLYLDSDVLVRRELAELWRSAPPDQPLAAVNDGWVLADDGLRHRFAGRYFNSGVLLADLRRWRAEALGPRVEALAQGWRSGAITETGDGGSLADLPRLSEQTALNLVVGQRWRELGTSWNFTRFHAEELEPAMGLEPGAMRRIGQDPAIVHFAGQPKPWSTEFGDMSPFHHEFMVLRRELEDGFDLGGLTWPAPPDFGPEVAVDRTMVALKLVEEARRSNQRRCLVFGVNALSRRIAEIARAQGLEIAAFATTSPFYYGGALGGVDIEPLEDAARRDVDCVLVGERRLAVSASAMVRAALSAAGADQPIFSFGRGRQTRSASQLA